MKALVIGAGIHGLTVACELAKRGIRVTIVDSKHEILMGTSNGTHNRVNMGYHYPRSIETAQECYKGFEYFRRNLSSALYYPEACYYAIDSSNSLVDAEQYMSFLNEAGLKYSIECPPNDILNKDHISTSFKVLEPCYDVQILRRLYHQKIENLSINLLLGFDIIDGDINNEKVKLVSSSNHIITEKFDIIVNATYALTNNIQKILGCEENRKIYTYQKTEVVVTEYDKCVLPSVTVMDGPFITVLPYSYGGHHNKYVVYDVVNSVHEESTGEFLPIDMMQKSYSTKYEDMQKHGEKYFSFMKDLKPVSSLWALRPIPITTLNDDSRVTNLVKHKIHKSFYSILEGKFVSAPLQGEIIAESILQEVT